VVRCRQFGDKRAPHGFSRAYQKADGSLARTVCRTGGIAYRRRSHKKDEGRPWFTCGRLFCGRLFWTLLVQVLYTPAKYVEKVRSQFLSLSLSLSLSPPVDRRGVSLVDPS
jgi:hypothetical protein